MRGDYLKTCLECGVTYRTKCRARKYCYPCAAKRRIYARRPSDGGMREYTENVVDYSPHNLVLK